jgi:hypothetical protein
MVVAGRARAAPDVAGAGELGLVAALVAQGRARPRRRRGKLTMAYLNCVVLKEEESHERMTSWSHQTVV